MTEQEKIERGKAMYREGHSITQISEILGVRGSLYRLVNKFGLVGNGSYSVEELRLALRHGGRDREKMKDLLKNGVSTFAEKEGVSRRGARLYLEVRGLWSRSDAETGVRAFYEGGMDLLVAGRWWGFSHRETRALNIPGKRGRKAASGEILSEMWRLYSVEGKTLQEIGVVYDISLTTVWHRLRKAGYDLKDARAGRVRERTGCVVSPRKGWGWGKEVVRLHGEGKTNKEIGDLLDISRQAVSYHLIKARKAASKTKKES